MIEESTRKLVARTHPCHATLKRLGNLTQIFRCAVKGVLFPAGANPARQLSLQPEALEAVQGGNELD